MLNNTQIITNVYKILILPFFLMLALGPYPLKIFGFLIDHIATLLLAIVCFLSLIKNSRKQITSLDMILIVYLFSIVPSIISSKDFDLSFERYIISLGYSAIFISITKINFTPANYRLLFYTSLVSVISISILILSLYFYGNYTLDSRFAVASDYQSLAAEGHSTDSGAVDPNMTAMGMVLLFAFCLPGLISIRNNKTRRHMILLFFIITLMLCVLLNSRTGQISTLIISLIICFSKKSISFADKNWLAINFLILLLLFSAYSLYDIYITSITDRYTDMFENERGENGRIDLLTRAVETFFSTTKNIWAGDGYMIWNPHNVYVEHFVNSGFITGILNLILLSGLYFRCVKIAIKKIGSPVFVNVMMIPFLFMLTTYGHTKTFWVGLAFTWILANINFQQVWKL